jgi:hypothetical protein
MNIRKFIFPMQNAVLKALSKVKYLMKLGEAIIYNQLN